MKLYYVYYCNDYGVELDVFFDEKKEILTWWSLNDAHYRHEYMSPLFKLMGYEVVVSDEDKELIEKIEATCL